MKTIITIATLIALTGVARAAETQPTSTTTRALQGGAVGAIAGAVIGNNSGSHNGGKGAMIGAGAGALLGVLYGQNEKINQQQQAQPQVVVVSTNPRVDHGARQQARQLALQDLADAQRNLESALYLQRDADARVALAEAKLAAAQDAAERLR